MTEDKKYTENTEIYELEAASFVIRATIEEVYDTWVNMKETLLMVESNCLNDINEQLFKYEIALAALSLDLIALHNLFPQPKSDRLHQHLVDTIAGIDELIFGGVEEYREYGKNMIENVYFPLAQEAIQNMIKGVGNMVIDEISIEIICFKMEIENPGPMFITALSSCIGPLLGKWKWLKNEFVVI